MLKWSINVWYYWIIRTVGVSVTKNYMFNNLKAVYLLHSHFLGARSCRVL